MSPQSQISTNQFQIFMEQQQKQHLELLGALGKELEKQTGRIAAVKRKWEVWVIIGAIILAGAGSTAFTAAIISSKTAPIKAEMAEMAEGFQNMDYSFNGNPATGTKGLNERLGAIEAKLNK